MVKLPSRSRMDITFSLWKVPSTRSRSSGEISRSMLVRLRAKKSVPDFSTPSSSYSLVALYSTKFSVSGSTI